MGLGLQLVSDQGRVRVRSKIRLMISLWFVLILVLYFRLGL